MPLRCLFTQISPGRDESSLHFGHGLDELMPSTTDTNERPPQVHGSETPSQEAMEHTSNGLQEFSHVFPATYERHSTRNLE